MGKRLAGRVAVFQRNVQNTFAAVAQVPKGEGQPPAKQVLPQPHAGNASEFSGYVTLRIPQHCGQAMQRDRLVVLAADAGVNLVDHALDVPMPLTHGFSLL